jgi:hypothetical protein
LHHELAEKNFLLLHELRLRAGNVTFPDARRLEFTIDEHLLDAVTVNVVPNSVSLNQAIEKCRSTFCDLLKQLIGSDWSWPEFTTPAR